LEFAIASYCDVLIRGHRRRREEEGNKEASFVLQQFYPARNLHTAVKVSKLKNTAKSTNSRINTNNN